MRYLVLCPPSPVDPRELELRSSAELYAALPVDREFATEALAANYVRMRFFDAVAMPIPLEIGSGRIEILGFIPDPSRQVDPDAEIPFALFVQCCADNDAERAQLKKRRPFDRAIWKIPVCRPDIVTTHRIDLRSSDLEVPAFVDAKVGSHDGRLTIYVEIGGTEMSIRFDDPRLQLWSCPEMTRPTDQRVA